MHVRGFTLVEVLVAMGLLSAGALAGVCLLAAGTRAMFAARTQGVSVTAASARLDELRSLRFEFDASGQRITDVSTSLAVNPPTPGGGGLTPGGGTLDSNVSGFVDYLDASGAWVGAGPSPPATAAFVRRWAIEAPEGPDLLVLQVLVRPLAEPTSDARAGIGGARLVTMRARVRP